jgi:hypothetical protein
MVGLRGAWDSEYGFREQMRLKRKEYIKGISLLLNIVRKEEVGGLGCCWRSGASWGNGGSGSRLETIRWRRVAR